MRGFTSLVLLLSLMAGCTPYIPVKDDFGVSALTPAGAVPPEFAAFNNYQPGGVGLQAAQLCATHFATIEQRVIPAEPGQMVAARGRCTPYTVSLGP